MIQPRNSCPHSHYSDESVRLSVGRSVRVHACARAVRRARTAAQQEQKDNNKHQQKKLSKKTRRLDEKERKSQYLHEHELDHAADEKIPAYSVLESGRRASVRFKPLDCNPAQITSKHCLLERARLPRGSIFLIRTGGSGLFLCSGLRLSGYLWRW